MPLHWHFTGGMVAALRAVSTWLVVGERACVVSTAKAQLWVTRTGIPYGDLLEGYEIELPDECDTLDVWTDDDGVHVCSDGEELIYAAKRRVVPRRGRCLPSAWLAAFAHEAIQPTRIEIAMEREPLRFEFRG